MAKKLTSICLALSMLMMVGLTGMAYTLPANANAVIVTKANGVYTVEVSNPVYANADVTVVAVANGENIPDNMEDANVAYFNEKKADADGKVSFTFKPKDGFDNSKGLYVAVSTERGVDTVIARAKYSVKDTSSIKNGSVIADATVNEGDTLYFSVNPNFGYKVASVKVNETVKTDYVVEYVTEDIEISVEYEVAEASITDATIFDAEIIPSEFSTQYKGMTEDALNAKYAAVIFSKVSSLAYECGIVYSKTNDKPTVGDDDCTGVTAEKFGSQGAFGMYLFSEVENNTPYNVRTYVKSADGTYSYGAVTIFTLKAVGTSDAE